MRDILVLYEWRSSDGIARITYEREDRTRYTVEKIQRLWFVPPEQREKL